MAPNSSTERFNRISSKWFIFKGISNEVSSRELLYETLHVHCVRYWGSVLSHINLRMYLHAICIMQCAASGIVSISWVIACFGQYANLEDFGGILYYVS